MTRSSFAGLVLAALLLGGCSAPAPSTSDPSTPQGGSSSEAAPAPGPEICEMTEWPRIDGALAEERYADAAMFLSNVFPTESVKPDFLRLRELVPAYAEVVASGDAAAIEAAADDQAEIETIHTRLQGYFTEFCG